MYNIYHILVTTTCIVYKITVIGERLRMYGKLYHTHIYTRMLFIYRYCIVIVYMHMHIIYNIYSYPCVCIYIYLTYLLFVYIV